MWHLRLSAHCLLYRCEAAHSATLRAGCDRDQAQAKAQVAASRAAVAWGMQEEDAIWTTAFCTGKLTCDLAVADGLQPHEVAQIASSAASQMARAEAERGMQGLEDAAMEAGKAAARVGLDLGMGEQTSYEVAAATAAEMAEGLASAAWKRVMESTLWMCGWQCPHNSSRDLRVDLA
ncbi:unnamed protein product [Symbiodinium necroappetens]|uniref:Uncharacterized protein n=1 Tax=Symbiodinium necroappetens TaxID=1628268 RepID=A0A812JKC0_9DINO|nr:unnamed protein product [Symbiodinium necroappetens]